MSDLIQLKVSLVTSSPATLTQGEAAYSFVSDTLFIGAPNNTIVAIGGAGLFATKAYAQSLVASAGTGDMQKSVYDTTNNGIVDNAEKLGGVVASLYALKTDITTAINNLLNGAGSAYDTLKELQDLITADESAASALTITVAGKLQKDQNLSDLANVATARTNLGLGTMATQAANNVNITGGVIDGITINGGTF